MIGGIVNSVAKIVRPLAVNSVKAESASVVKMGAFGTSQKQGYKTQDAERVFQQFVKQNPQKDSESSIFGIGMKNQQETEKFDPFEVLGLQKNSTKDQIKHAYKELAVKCHPKRDSSIEASEKFVNVCRAYEMLKDGTMQNESKSFAGQFQKNMKDILNSEVGISKQSTSSSTKILTAELYSETKNIKKIGGTKLVTIEKEYNRNGKLIKFTRVQKTQENGEVQVEQTFDDGAEVKIINFK